MLEIFFIYFLCKSVGDILRKKNRSPIAVQILLVLFWFGGEVAGFVAGAVFLAMSGQGEDGLNLIVYLFALIGAALGAGLAFLIAAMIPPAAPPQPTYGYGTNFTGMPSSGNPYNPYDPSTPAQPPKNPFADR